ncbi:unnamed protein product [Urochloa humidicola]
MKDLYKSSVSEYPIVSIEDPFDQDDWSTYAKLTDEIGQQVQIRVAKAISQNTCNTLLLKKQTRGNTRAREFSQQVRYIQGVHILRTMPRRSMQKLGCLLGGFNWSCNKLTILIWM